MPHDGIESIDHKLQRMVRDRKPEDVQVPEHLIEKIPQILRKPDEIKWDGESLLYIRHLKKKDIVKGDQASNDRDRAKFVVRVNCKVRVETGERHAGRVGNWVWSATRVPADSLKNLEQVWP